MFEKICKDVFINESKQQQKLLVSPLSNLLIDNIHYILYIHVHDTNPFPSLTANSKDPLQTDFTNTISKKL